MSDTGLSEQSPPTRWAELYRLIVDPTAHGRALEPTDAANEAASVRIGNPVALIAEAEHAGAGKAIWAVVAPLRPDFLTIDIDKCADQVLSPTLEAGEEVGAAIVHLAASGSPDSLHISFVCPSPAARAFLLAHVDSIRRWARLETHQAVDVLTDRRVLRLPGSVSLKGGHFCRPVDVAGRPITAVEAVRRATLALATAPPVGSQGPVAMPVAAPAPGRIVVDPTLTESFELAEEAPRAWRRRKRLSDQEWRLMMSTPVAPHRSDQALKAAWVLWRNGVRSWAQAKWWYTNCPVFTKFAARDIRRPADKPGPSDCQKHWQSLVARARSHRPVLTIAEQDVVTQVREEIATWSDSPDLAVGVLAVLKHRFTDGHGLENRPVSVRCLAMWLNVHIDRAAAIRSNLIARGVLREARAHSQGPAREATLFSLAVPPSSNRSKPVHDVTAPSPTLPLTTGQPLSPTWGVLSHQAWLLYSILTDSPRDTTTLAQTVGLPTGSSRYGCGRLLRTLEQHGLAHRVGAGRGTRWTRGPVTVDEAAELCGATDRLRALRIRINAERSAWHAESRSEQLKAVLRLRRLRDRTRNSGSSGPPQLDLSALDGGWDDTRGWETKTAVRRRHVRTRGEIRRRPPPRAG